MNAFFLIIALSIGAGALLKASGIPFYFILPIMAASILIKRREIALIALFIPVGAFLSLRENLQGLECVGKISSSRNDTAVVRIQSVWNGKEWQKITGNGIAKLRRIEGSKIYCKKIYFRPQKYPEFFLKDCVTFPLKESLFDRLKVKIWKLSKKMSANRSLTMKMIISSSPKEAQKSGISHIFAVSGFHTALYFSIVFTIISGFSANMWFSYPLSLFITFLLIIPSGPSPSALRAFIMLFLWSLSKLIDYPVSKYNILGLSATISLFQNPLQILSPSFLMSHAGTLGILLSLEKSRNWWEPPIWAYLFSLPFSILFFRKVHLFAIVASFLITPLTPIYLLAGSSALLLALVGFSKLCIFILNSLTLIELPLKTLLTWFSTLPSINLSPLSSFVLSFIMICLISAVWWKRSSEIL